MCIAEAFSTYHVILAILGPEEIACYFGMVRFLDVTTFGYVTKSGGLEFLAQSNLYLM
jgi:hypothetical protein